jgi:dienelactone hydrolase
VSGDESPGRSSDVDDPGTQVAVEPVAVGESVAKRRRPRWWPLVGGVMLLASVLWVFGTAWGAVWASHPAGWVTLVIAGAAGAAAIVFALVAGPPTRTGWRRWLARAGLVLVTGVVVVVVVYTRPLEAEQVAIDALVDGGGVTIEESSTQLRLVPDDPATTGLAFYPGAKVDPRAYANALRPIAESGYPVVIVKQPFNLAILDSDAADAVVGDRGDDVDRWVIGGHSLGGAMAARYAEAERSELVGLLLYAAYPVVDMSARSDLSVASVWGTADGVADPADIDASVAELPGSAVFTAIEGGIHSYFGDYGLQRGDGVATVARRDAQAQIAAATLDLLGSIDAGARE